jgi:hypothetical protein
MPPPNSGPFWRNLKPEGSDDMVEEKSHMQNGARLLENWAEDLTDAVNRLKSLLDDIGEVQQEVCGTATLARQFMTLATIDDVFMKEFFMKVDPAMVILALERCDATTRNNFIEAAMYLQAHFRPKPDKPK